MQVIVKTNYNNKEEKEAIENVNSLLECNSVISINFKDDNGHKLTQYVALDGYTEIIVR